MTRYTQEDTLSTYLDLGRNSAIIFIADRALYSILGPQGLLGGL